MSPDRDRKGSRETAHEIRGLSGARQESVLTSEVRCGVMEYQRDDGAANPAYGEKGGYRRITVTLPPEAYERLIRESTRRKIANEPNGQLSSLLREAVMDYLKRTDLES